MVKLLGPKRGGCGRFSPGVSELAGMVCQHHRVAQGRQGRTRQISCWMRLAVTHITNRAAPMSYLVIAASIESGPHIGGFGTARQPHLEIAAASDRCTSGYWVGFTPSLPTSTWVATIGV